jgi:hypothetical protein
MGRYRIEQDAAHALRPPRVSPMAAVRAARSA